MAKRTDIQSILLIGSGPIVIGQACEFDYSGTQACKALKDDGYRIILVNSNPATIMTDPEFADRTYIEPLTPESLERIIEREKPDAILPTVGGQRTIDTDEPVRWDTDFGVAELQQLNLYDRTVEGLVLHDVPASTVQYHPEAGPGPHDAVHLFDRFVDGIAA